MTAPRYRYTIGMILLAMLWFGLALVARNHVHGPMFLLWSLVLLVTFLAALPTGR
jgi:hypothetical protein